jgi:hypothetical protein
MAKRISSWTRVAAIGSVAMTLSITLAATDASGKPKAKPKAATSASTPPRGQIGRKPGSGSCNNTDNKCSGKGETCTDNLCYCNASDGWGRCTKEPDAPDCAYLAGDMDNCGACGRRCKDTDICEKGKCIPQPCDRGETSCRQGCRDLKASDDACGSCNHACRTDLGFSCDNGACR